MLKRYLVCLTSNREQCEVDTAEIAKRNNAVDYVVDAEFGIFPMRQIAYRGFIIKEEEENNDDRTSKENMVQTL
jgi:hypothetical protein